MEDSEGILEKATLIRLWDDPPTLDPHLAVDAVSGTIIAEVFGGLVTINKDIEITPDLAETWNIGPDGRTYTFHLRRDGKFHDGKAVRAHDFKWSLERAADPVTQSAVAETYLGDIVGVREKLDGKDAEIEGVKVIDEYILEITVDAPKAYFVSKLTYPTAFVLDRENVGNDSEWFKTPNGTGPFKLAHYLRGDELVLTRNENYHLGPPKLAEVKFRLGGGDPLLMYLNDEIHILELGSLPTLDVVGPLVSDLHEAPPSFSVSYIGLNLDRPPFDDVKVRQALNYAIDRQRISDVLFAGALQLAKSILPPGFPGYNDGLSGYEFNPGKAIQLIRESKYGDSLENSPPIVLTVPGSVGSRLGPSLETILEMWSQNLGIDVEVQSTDWATYLGDLERGRFQMFGGLSWIADYPDPENFLDVLFHSGNPTNWTGYHNSQVDQLLEQARLEQDQNLRYGLYRRVEQKIVEDAPWILLWHSGVEYVLVKPYVHDYFLTPITVPVLRHVYMTQRRDDTEE